eukprot:scaffold714_cov121-Isochrysis_galbana.AAC.19
MTTAGAPTKAHVPWLQGHLLCALRASVCGGSTRRIVCLWKYPGGASAGHRGAKRYPSIAETCVQIEECLFNLEAAPACRL